MHKEIHSVTALVYFMLYVWQTKC